MKIRPKWVDGAVLTEAPGVGEALARPSSARRFRPPTAPVLRAARDTPGFGPVNQRRPAPSVPEALARPAGKGRGPIFATIEPHPGGMPRGAFALGAVSAAWMDLVGARRCRHAVMKSLY